MKERKRWKKRVVSLLMALAMVITQISVWNVGKESVQAEETSNDSESDDADIIIKNGDFENGLDNWTLEGIDTANYAVKWSTGHDSNDFEVWSSTSADITFTLSQEVTIPAGTYTLSVSSAGTAQCASVSIGDLCTLTPVWSSFSAENDAVTKTSDKFSVVEEKTLTVSVQGSLPATWGGFYLDNIVLNKVESADKSKLQSLIQKVPTTLSGFETTSAESLEKALKEANQCVGNDGATAEEIDSCYNALDAALSELRYSDDEIQIEKVNGLNERTDFIKGVDISTYLVETASGVKYKDQNGNYVEGKDFIRTFAQNGVNYIRLRVWNQPYDTDNNGNKFYYGGGNNDIDMAVKICNLIKEYNDTYANTYGEVKVLIDLHYSDFWADPDKQTAPKAWKDMTIDEKKTAVAEFTKDCLAKVEATGVTVGMLQIGNETNNGICGESYGTDNYLAIFRAGCDAVKAYNESKGYTTENGKWIKRVVHFTDPQSVGTSKALYLKTGDLSAKDATNPTDKGVDYDVYATSYYPYWHGTTDNLKAMLDEIAKTCGCEVMVAETQYIYTNADYDGADNQAYEGKNNINVSQWPVSVQGQANEIRDVINAVAQVGDCKGIGMFYWEPAWLGVGNAYNEDGTTNESALNSNKQKWNEFGSGWASDYAGTYDAQAEKWGGGGTNNENASLFDFSGNPLASLNVFKYVNYGAVAKKKSFYTAKSLCDVVVKMGYSKEQIKNQLAESIEYTYNDATTGQADIAWNENSLAKAEQEISSTKAIGNSYTITGTIDVDGTKQNISCNILVDPSENLLINGDFEVYAEQWNFSFAQESNILWSAIASDGSVDGNANPRNDSNGSIVFNTYSNVVGSDSTADVYSGSVSQTVSIKEAGIYEAKAFFEGADKAGSNNGEAINLSVTDGNGVKAVSNAIRLDGWKVWQCATVSNIVVTQDMINSGKNIVTVSANVCIKKDVWGSIDDVYLYKVGNVTDSGSNGSSTVTPSTPSTSADTDKKDDTNETTTVEKKVTATTPSGETVEATVTVSKDKDGNVTEATASVTGTKAAFSAEVAAEIAKAAGTDNAAITASVTDKNGNEKYTVTVDSKNLTANKKLQVVAIDPETGAYKLVNAKTYTVGEDGSINVSLAAGENYQLITQTEMKAVEKAILKTVEVKKSSATVKKGKKTQIKLSSDLDMDNVKSITYKTEKKSVATVNKSGKITTKKKGTVTIKAVVTLKNGKKKTVSMKLKVK